MLKSSQTYANLWQCSVYSLIKLYQMNNPVNCRYFYGDYHRGRNKEECRLIEGNPQNQRPWKRKLCDTCPIPEMLIVSNSRHLLLEAEVQRKMLRDRVVVTLAVCSKHITELGDGRYCPECAAESSQNS